MAHTIADLGEFGLITRITARFPKRDDVIIGPGDDAAVLRTTDQRVVATTDLLVEGRHFRRDWSSGSDIGHKAAAQNLADIAAMGARPTALLLGFAAPPDLPVAWVDGFCEGLEAECAAAGATVAGGDVVGSDTMTLAITALGALDGGPPIRRDTAHPGDVVAVTGRLGFPAAGLALLEAGLTEPIECVRAHRRPAPPYAAGPAAAALGATAMLDVSDGLLQDLGHIAAASGVAIDVTSADLPPAPSLADAARRLTARDGVERSPLRWMLSGGEDHALVATFPARTALPPDWTVIGAVTAGDGVTVDTTSVTESGWDHFGDAAAPKRRQ